MSDSRKRYERLLVRLRADQKTFIQNDADDRYPERHGVTEQSRGFSPALRDGIDFWMAHYDDIFLPWIVSRGNLPPEERS